jgi:hypothetical protein
LGVTGLEVIDYRFQTRNLSGSSRCPIEGIKHQHDILLPFELVESEFRAAKVASQLKIGRLLSNSDHDDPSFLKI